MPKSDRELMTRAEVMAELDLRDPDTLRRWEKQGIGPPVLRLGRLHSRVRFPRREFWEWVRERMAESQS
jgi:hypothetical protein